MKQITRHARQFSLWAFQRVYRLDQRIRESLTRLGLWLACVLLISGVMGINTRLNLASQLFSLLLVMFILAGVSGFGFRPRLRIERTLPSMATMDEPCRYRIRVTNESSRISPEVCLHDELTITFPSLEAFCQRHDPRDHQRNAFDRLVGYPRWLGMVLESRGGVSPQCNLPALAPGQSLDLSLEFTPRRRGYIQFQGFRITHADPLGLVNAGFRKPLVGRLLILPRRYPVRRLELAGSRRYQPLGRQPRAIQGDAEEFVGLRDYQPGDSLRNIHWKSWARVGKPVIKEYRPEYSNRHALVLDTLGPAVSATRLEAAVSVAASLAPGLEKPDSLVDLVFVGNRIYRVSSGPGGMDIPGLLRILATVKALPGEPFTTLSRQLLADDPPFAACCLVLLGWDTARSSLVQALRQRGRDVVALVVVDSVDTAPTRHYHRLPADDLAGALARLRVS